MKKISLFLCVALTSCSVVRGLVTDGSGGPGIFSYEQHPHVTVANGAETFSFPVASRRADWIDTLHFYNLGKHCVNMTLPEAFEGKSSTQGVMIIQQDSIVFEKYWGSFSSDKLATIFSVSKSITSLLCGIAVDEGYIKSIDDPVTNYLPELKKKDPMWQKLTVRHLLDMRSGLDFEDEYSIKLKEIKRLKGIADLNYGHNVYRQVRKLKFRNEPGSKHYYESMTSQILGLVIERATGTPYYDYLSQKIWIPLQMESAALVNIDSPRHKVSHCFGGISTTMKDLAKIGRLYLNEGMWNGKRIVSKEWIHMSGDYDTSNEGYHFNWYNSSSYGESKPEFPGYYALGIGHQVLYVNPYKKLIMVRIGQGNNSWSFVPDIFEQLSNRWQD